MGGPVELGADRLALRTWYDELSAQEVAVLELPSEPPANPVRILPQEHGDSLEEQLTVGKRLFLSARHPFYLARLGDAEAALVGSGYQGPTKPLRTLASYLKFCGLSRECLHMRPEFILALKDATFLGVHQDWEEVRLATATILGLSGFPVPPPNAVEVHLPYKLLIDGSLISFLSGKRVLLIGHLAPELMRRWKEPAFVEAYSRFGRFDQVPVIGAIGAKKRGEGLWKDIDLITALADKYDYDVALLACGAPAKILARRIHSRGKTALDVGFVFDALLGDPERRKRPILRETSWPETGWEIPA
jgi:hypothetical protein